MSTRTFLLALLAITALAAGLRLFRLGEPSMWIDELFIVFHVAREPGIDWWLRPLAYLPTKIGLQWQGIDVASINPTAYHLWRDQGINELTVRLPSAIIGIASVFILGYLTQRLVDRRTALLLALLLAVTTWHLWVSQTGRFYVQQILLYNICFILYYDGMTRRSPATLAACVLFFILAFMTQLTSPMILGVFAIDMAHRWWTRPAHRPGPLAWLAIAAALVATAAVVVWWYIASDFSAAGQSAPVLVAGTVWFVGIPVAVFAAAALAWLWRRDRQLALFLAAGAVVPTAALIAIGWLGAEVHTRYASPAIYAWLLLAAISLVAIYDHLRWRTGPALAAAPLALVLAAALVTDAIYYTAGHGYRPRWREASEFIAQHRDTDELILADYIPHHQARYYLGTENVEQVPFDLDSEDLAYFDQPAWLILRGSSPTGRNRADHLPDQLQLKAYFAARVFQPYSSVHVYYYPGPDEPARKNAGKP